LGAASGLGFPNRGSALAPDRVREASTMLWQRSGAGLVWEGIVRLAGPPDAKPLATLLRFNRCLARRVSALARGDDLLVVIGGDHAIAPGTWAGVRQALGGKLGLIWIDAHLDAHTPQTSHTGNLHGMPLAALLGQGPKAFVQVTGETPILDAATVVVLGVRSFEAEEAALLDRLGVRVVAMDEVRRRGLGQVFAEAVETAARNTAGFGISLDLDVIDPHAAPGVNTPVAHGIQAGDLIEALRALRADARLKAVEIAEYNPALDSADATLNLLLDLLAALLPDGQPAHPLRLETRYGARNYDPQPVMLTRGKGVFVWDADGRRYFDLMGAYSAQTFGHCHPTLVAALTHQAKRLTLTSRVFHTATLGPFLARACELTGMDRALPVNSGTEAVETALKAARKWAYQVKRIPEDEAEIIVCEGNFHGRTIAIVGFSSEPQYRDGFGPYAPGFVRIPYGDADALERAITARTAAFLVEPIQGEAGIIVPPAGYLARCAAICRRHDVLFIADEVQTGLGRTGKLLACEHEQVKPDGLILGKALGGGLLPVSMFLARQDVMAVFGPGDHGSTFGGNPLACAVGLAALDLLVGEHLADRAAGQGEYFLAALRSLDAPAIREVRGRGLMLGMELKPEVISAQQMTLRLQEEGVLTRAVHHDVLRFAPPLIISRPQIDRALAGIRRAFHP
jgi:ornithine--oxo-acid transaminase